MTAPLTSLEWDGADPAALAAELRASAPDHAEIAPRVAALIAEVRAGGDEAARELSRRLDGAEPLALLVSAERCAAAAAAIEGELRGALEAAAANIRAVAEAQPAAAEVVVTPGAGQRVAVSEHPVEAAAIYVPGGRAAYPSTVLMGALAARSAGVGRVVVASPPGPDGLPDRAVLAACEIAGADEMVALGGVQAIAALAYGTETIAPVDVIAGPGGPWVQEAKLLVSRVVGTDSYAGPSELVVVADGSVPARWLALDLCAQAEHGADGLLVAIGAGAGALEGLAPELARIAASEPSVSEGPVTLVEAPGIDAALDLASALAPEHLELACEGAADLVGRVRAAGCVLLGAEGGTAFADYAAGSNHVLPTGGAARFAGPLGPGTFRRRMSVVEVGTGAAELATAVAAIAKAEGFVVHGASARARVSGDGC